MKDVVGSDPPTDPQFEQVLAEYLEATAAEGSVPNGWVAAHPEHAPALREFLENLDWMRRLVGPAPAEESTRPTADHDVGPSDAAAAPGAPDGPAAGRADALTTIGAGRYVGWRPHAQGGLGEVFTAVDTELHRVVALKRIQDRHAGDAPCRRHFLLEAEVTARLDHPGVVPVYSLFEDAAGRPCYTMRFIEGKTLDAALHAYHDGPPDPVAFRRLLQSFIQACETIGYAHSRGVLHRDMKPQNVMLGKFGETIVVDWGLAKVVGRARQDGANSPEVTLRLVGDSSLDRTVMGTAVGTPAYMSPEQAAGRWDVINTASDVYNLGAMLYALLTGRPPQEGGNWPELNQKIQRGDFPRPRAVNASVPKALEAVCLKAMALRPEDRYLSAVELASDVERWLADEPVSAYREPVATRLRRRARRHKILVASGAVGLAVLAASAWAISLERIRTETQRSLKSTYHAASARQSLMLSAIVARQNQLEESARVALDGLAARVSHDSRLDGPELRPLSRDLLRKVLGYWDDAIRIDSRAGRAPGGRTQFYRQQRVLALARLGEHVEAAAEAEDLWSGLRVQERSSEAAYHFARVFSLCAAATQGEGDRERAGRYADQAMEYLLAVFRGGLLGGAALEQALDLDPDFAALRAREDFRELLRKVEANPR